MKNHYHRGLLFLLAIDSLLTLGLIGLGSFISSSGYGLAIPEWPLVQGGLIPPQLVAGIWYEFLHRLLAATVGLLTLLAGSYILARDPRPEVRRLALTAMLAIVVQIILGGLGVLWEFPRWLESAHALLAPLFFASLVVLVTVFSWEWQKGRKGRISFDNRAFRKTRAAATMLLVQIVLGVAVRHARIPWLLGAALILHLITALGVVVIAIAMAVSVLRHYRKGPIGVVGWAVIPLVLLQLVIGFGVLLLLPPSGHGEGQAEPAYVAHAIAHSILAAILLGCSTYLAMMVRRKSALARTPRVVKIERSNLVALE